jgi:hypothetical protein
MRQAILIAGLAAFTTIPALAQSPTPLHSGSTALGATVPGPQLAQAQAPQYTPGAAPTVLAPTAPPPPQTEVPPPAPSPSYVWEPGHWLWNGIQYVWQSGRYVERPTVSATYVGGHWERHPNGWVWVEGHWDHPGIGSSVPPAGRPQAR